MLYEVGQAEAALATLEEALIFFQDVTERHGMAFALTQALSTQPASTDETKVSPPSNPLSERERQVLSLVAEGLSNQQIADKLFITERTARFHVTSIFNKLGADNRAQAVALATQRGLI